MATTSKTIVISGVDMSFFGLVRFFVKVYFAMIPAALLVGLVLFALQFFLGASLLGLMAALGAGA